MPPPPPPPQFTTPRIDRLRERGGGLSLAVCVSDEVKTAYSGNALSYMLSNLSPLDFTTFVLAAIEEEITSSFALCPLLSLIQLSRSQIETITSIFGFLHAHHLTRLQLLHYCFSFFLCVHLLPLVLLCIPSARQISFELFPGRRKTGFRFPTASPQTKLGTDL